VDVENVAFIVPQTTTKITAAASKPRRICLVGLFMVSSLIAGRAAVVSLKIDHLVITEVYSCSAVSRHG
jgi:hypothetical protein